MKLHFRNELSLRKALYAKHRMSMFVDKFSNCFIPFYSQFYVTKINYVGHKSYEKKTNVLD